MASSAGCTLVASLTAPKTPGILITRNPVPRRVAFSNEGLQNFATSRLQLIVAKATPDKPITKSVSIICQECEGNGAKQCTQCEGSGVNTKDHFNGQFKAGGLCWLCRGKKEILCGNCNGAGFMGGFMSTGEG